MEIVMNHTQYLEWKYGSKNNLNIKLENLGIINSKKLEKQLIIGIGTGLFLISNPSIAMATSTINLSGIDNLGNTFLDIVRTVGYWIALISALKDIIKVTMKGGNNTSEIGRLIIMYVLAFASLYFVPTLFDVVKEAF